MSTKNLKDTAQIDMFDLLAAQEIKESLNPRDHVSKKKEKVLSPQNLSERCHECIFFLTCNRESVIIDSAGRCGEFVVNDKSGIYFVKAILECYSATGGKVNFGKNLATSRELAEKLKDAMVHCELRYSWPGVKVNMESG
jgi:hypothetical protein